MKTIQWLLLGGVAGLLVAAAPGCGTKAKDCDASNCATGCCDADGECQQGTLQNACGVGGAACSVCTGDQTCGGGQCTAPSSGGGSLTIDQLCQQLFPVECDVMVRCGYMSSSTACATTVFGNAECAAEQKAAIKDGRIAYHGDKAKACLEAFKDVACDALFGSEAPAACDEVFEGKVATNGTCYSSDECADTDGCATSTSTCPGQCRPLKTAGQTVDFSLGEECAKGLYEYSVDTSSYVCQTPVALGASCAPQMGSSDLQQCVHGAGCDGASQTCVKLGTAGSACTQMGECQTNLSCQNGTCSELAGVGDTCSTGSMIRCQYDLTCLHSTPSVDPGVCQAPAGAGGACSDNSTGCQQGYYCAGLSFGPPTNGTCTAITPIGSACTDFYQCGQQAFCSDQGVCTAFKALGEACNSSMECYQASCDSGICTPYSCQDPTP